MREKEIMSLQYSSAILEITEANPSFDKGKLRIAYTGKNRNGSFISKEAFERAIPSMFGTPVVANYIREENEIGSHDGEFIDTEDGDIKYVNITQPVGFVPPGAAWEWEVVNDKSGIHQYLTTEVILWKRQEAYEKIKENGITDESMEITVERGQMCDDYYNIEDFYFTAFCLLGTAEPCFESAALLTFDCNGSQLQKDLSEMFEEFKLAFKVEETKPEEGESKNMDKLHELLEKFNLSVDELSFEVEGLSDEELEAKFEEVYGESEPENETEPETEPEAETDAETDETETDDFALSNQVREQLQRAVRAAEQMEDEYGEYPRYYMVDFDSETSEVYFEDVTDWNLYGTVYSFNGDNVVVDFACKKRKKYAIVDFDEGEEVFSMKECVDEVLNAFKKKCDDKYNALNEKYNNLVKSEYEKEAAELFENFEEKLGGDPEFEALKKSNDISNIQDLEDKLFCMVGKKQFKFNTKVPQRSPKAPVIRANKTAPKGPYGDLFDFIEE